MLIEEAHIYPFIKDCLEKLPIIEIPRGKYFSKAENKDAQIYYILKGEVKVESISDMGKKILVDSISENEFAGQISYLRNSNLYCNSLAVTDLKLLCIKADIMSELMKNSEFSTVFYFKTSSRIYQMYKKMLMNNLFNQCELVAYYILAQSCDNKFIYKSIYDICENLNISRRSLYNILNNFEEKDIIIKEKNGIFVIRDVDFLEEKSNKVKMFLENEY